MNIYYHNPRCSKSRQGLQLLDELGIKYTVKEYLKEPLKESELQTLMQKLGKSPKEVIRTKEDIYKEQGLANKDLTDKQWIQTIIKHPKLLERPILETKTKAIIGRPPEDLKKILSK